MKVGSTRLRLFVAGWAATSSIGSCAFPNYSFEDEVTGIGGRGSKPPGQSTASGGGGDHGGEAGEGGAGDAPDPPAAGGEAGAPGPIRGGAGGEGGQGGGEGGRGEQPPAIKVCADFESFPADCHCADYQGHAYLYCSGARTWAMAGYQCGFHDMRLVALDDPAENEWLIDKVVEITQGSFHYFWIGASSDGDPAVWSWPDEVDFWEGGTDGAPIGSGYAGWRGGNPDAGAGACAFAGKDGWEDGGCKDTRPYACESY